MTHSFCHRRTDHFSVFSFQRIKLPRIISGRSLVGTRLHFSRSGTARPGGNRMCHSVFQKVPFGPHPWDSQKHCVFQSLSQGVLLPSQGIHLSKGVTRSGFLLSSVLRASLGTAPALQQAVSSSRLSPSLYQAWPQRRPSSPLPQTSGLPRDSSLRDASRLDP